MSNLNRRIELPAHEPKGAVFLAQEVDAPDGTGTYLMVGVGTGEGRLSVILPHRSLEHLVSALSNHKNHRLVGVPVQKAEEKE